MGKTTAKNPRIVFVFPRCTRDLELTVDRDKSDWVIKGEKRALSFPYEADVAYKGGTNLVQITVEGDAFEVRAHEEIREAEDSSSDSQVDVE